MILSRNTILQGGKYRIEKSLGQGGFGITYLATQVQLGRKVAIKEFFMKDFCERKTDTQVSLGSVGCCEMVERFRSKFIKEAQTIAQFNNPYIVRVYDIFEENNTAYYVMEYHDGGSLADLVKSNGHLPESRAISYIRQIADALDYLHHRKINHLDVKPGNILLNEDGNAVLIDFGLSKHYDSAGNQTSTTPVGISHGYAPMEQYRKGGVGTFSPTTDIYSLGATLYKMLTGTTPPEASDLLNMGLPPMKVEVSAVVRNAVEKAMSPLINDRPQSISAFMALLEEKSQEPAKAAVEPDEKTRVAEDEKTNYAAETATAPAVTEKRVENDMDSTIHPAPEAKKIPASATPSYPEPTPKKKPMRMIIGIACVVIAAIAGSCVFGADKEPIAVKKPAAPERQGWNNEGYPLYGDVAKMTARVDTEAGVQYVYFNEQGDVLRMELYNGDGESEYDYRYDAAGNMIEDAYYYDGELYSKRTYRYDASGNMIEEANYNSYGEFDGKNTYRYDAAGNRIEQANYTSYGELYSKHTYRYDAAGNMIEDAYYYDGELYSKRTCRYDASGNKIEEVYYNSDGELVYKSTCRYDAAGNMIEDARYNSDGELSSKITQRYDAAGNMIEAVGYNSDGELNKYTYRYDAAGNIIEEAHYSSDGSLDEKVTLEIEYR